MAWEVLRDINMNPLNTIVPLRKLVLIIAALACLNRAQAHPGHAHDGGAAHVMSHGTGWLLAVALVGFGVWVVRRRGRVGARVPVPVPVDAGSPRKRGR